MHQSIRYYSDIQNKRILIRENDIVFQYFKEVKDESLFIANNVYIEFPGADLSQIQEENLQGTRYNFFKNDIIITDIPAWKSIRIKNIYPDTDLIFDGNDKYHFYFDNNNSHYMEKAITYSSSFHDIKKIREKEQHNEHIIWGSYLGGTLFDTCRAIKYDSGNNAVIVGWTNSRNIPCPDGYSQTFSGIWDIYVAKISFDNNDLVWGTYIGGKGRDIGYYAAIDKADNIIIAGYTESDDIPVSNAFDNTFNGNRDIYTAKISPDGNELIWATYIGGTNIDGATSVYLDSMDNIVISGYSFSQNIPLVNSIYPSHSGHADIYIAMLSKNGQNIIFSTFLGGQENDQARAITMDTDNNIYILAWTRSNDIPVSEGHAKKTDDSRDTYLAKLSPWGQGLLWARLIGGSESDYGRRIRMNSRQEIIIAGFTNSPDFPVQNGFNNIHGGSFDSFIMKLANCDGNIISGSFIGGSSSDYCYAMAIDSQDNVFIASSTYSRDSQWIYIAKISDKLDSIVWDTSVSGDLDDICLAMEVDKYDHILIACQTNSNNLPVPYGFDRTYNGNGDIYIAKLNPWITDLPDASVSGHDIVFTESATSSINIQAKIRNNGRQAVQQGTIRFTGSHSNTDFFIAEEHFDIICPQGSININVEYDIQNTSFDTLRRHTISVELMNILPTDANPDNNHAENSILLPVDLSSFNAKAYSEKVIISWSTNNEYQISHYDIYRIFPKASIIMPIPVKINQWPIINTGSLQNKADYTIIDHIEDQKPYLYLLQAITTCENTISWKTPLIRIF